MALNRSSASEKIPPTGSGAVSRSVKIFRGLGAVACVGIAFTTLIGMARNEFGDGPMLTAFGVFGGVLLAALGVCREEFTATFRSVRFRVAVNVLIQALIGAAILGCFLYVFGVKLYVRGDWATARPYRLSEETRRTLKDLTVEGVPNVEVILLEGEPPYGMDPRQYARERDRIKDLLKEYRLQADTLAPNKFHFRTVRMLREAEELKRLAERMKIETFSHAEMDALIIFCGEKYRLIRKNELYGQGSFGTRKVTRRVFQGERVCTSNLRVLLRPKDDRPVIYFTVGHEERSPRVPEDGLSALQRRLLLSNFSVRELNLKNELDVPKDAQVVVICGPRRAFQPEEIGRLNAYLSRPTGRPALLACLDPIYPALPGEALESSGLEPLLEAYAVKVRQDYIARAYRPTFVGEADPLPEFPVNPASREDFLRPLWSSGREASVIFERPCVLEVVNESPNKLRGYRAEAILESLAFDRFKTLRVWADPVTKDAPRAAPDEDSLKGPLTMATLSEVKDPFGETKTGATVMVAADSNFAADKHFNAFQDNQNQLFLEACIRRLAGREELLGAIPPNEVELRAVKISPEDYRLLFVLLALGLPVLFLFAGVVVWAGRRT